MTSPQPTTEVVDETRNALRECIDKLHVLVVCGRHDEAEAACAQRAISIAETALAKLPPPVDPDIEEASLESVWQQARQNHATYSATGSTEQDIRFFALGLAGEAGEVANFVKKRWRDGEGHHADLRKECADVFAYNIMLADALGMTASDLLGVVAEKQQVFIAKMKALRGHELATQSKEQSNG